MNNKKQASGHHLSGHLGALGQEPWMMNTYRFLVFLQHHMSSVDTQRGDLNPLIRKRPSFPLPLPSAVFPAVSRAYFLWIPGWCLSSLSGSTQMEQLPRFTCFSPGFTLCSRLLVPRVSFYYVIALLCQNLSVHHSFYCFFIQNASEKIQCLWPFLSCGNGL